VCARARAYVLCMCVYVCMCVRVCVKKKANHSLPVLCNITGGCLSLLQGSRSRLGAGLYFISRLVCNVVNKLSKNE